MLPVKNKGKWENYDQFINKLIIFNKVWIFKFCSDISENFIVGKIIPFYIFQDWDPSSKRRNSFGCTVFGGVRGDEEKDPNILHCNGLEIYVDVC